MPKLALRPSITGRSMLLRLSACGLVGIATWWAFGPVELPALPATATSVSRVTVVAVSEPALDESSFRTPIWIAPAMAVGPPAPEEPPTPPAPPAPPRNLQLLAIVRDEGLLKAVIYDSESDQVLTVAAGERISGHTVSSVTELMLTLGGSAEDPSHPTVHLPLDPDLPRQGSP